MRLASWGGVTDTVYSDDEMRFMRQIGIEALLFANLPVDPVQNQVPYDALAMRVRAAERQGLQVFSVENVHPHEHYMVPIILGSPGRDAAVEAIQATIRNLGRAGIPHFGYHWMVSSATTSPVVRTAMTPSERGGAEVTSFDAAAVAGIRYRDREHSAAELRDNHERFLDAVLPVARECGVTLSMHPDDPPVPAVGGVARAFSTVAAFRAVREDPNWGLTFCLGNWTLMAGADLVDVARSLVPRINYVHVQGVHGKPERFSECFLDRSDANLPVVLEALFEAGFDGTVMPAHFPRLTGDSGLAEGAAALAWAVGYVRAILQNIETTRAAASPAGARAQEATR